MPGVGECFYVAEMWQDMGLVSSGGMGPTRLSSAEMLAWQQGTRRALLPWEFTTIRDMSMSYLAMLHEGEKPETYSPFQITAYDADVVGQKIENVFDALIQAGK